MAGVKGLVNMSGGLGLNRAWQSLPTVNKPFFFVAKPSSVRKAARDPAMNVTMMLPKFSPAKILEDIIFNLRFKIPDDKVESPVQSGNEGGIEVEGTVERTIQEQEELLETLKEESRRAGIQELDEPLPDGEETAAMAGDTLNPSYLWERREKDLVAERDLKFTSPGFSFSAAGLLFPYHLGVCQCLIEQGYITLLEAA